MLAELLELGKKELTRSLCNLSIRLRMKAELLAAETELLFHDSTLEALAYQLLPKRDVLLLEAHNLSGGVAYGFHR